MWTKEDWFTIAEFVDTLRRHRWVMRTRIACTRVIMGRLLTGSILTLSVSKIQHFREERMSSATSAIILRLSPSLILQRTKWTWSLSVRGALIIGERRNSMKMTFSLKIVMMIDWSMEGTEKMRNCLKN